MQGRRGITISKFGSIRTRLITAFILVVALPMSVVIAVRAISGSEGAQAQLASQLDIVAGLKDAAINTRGATLKAELGNGLIGENTLQYVVALVKKGPGWEESSDFRTAHDIMDRRFRQLMAQTKRFDTIFLMDRRGQVVLSTEPALEGRVYSHTDFFQDGLKEAVVHASVLSKMAIIIARPVTDERGRVLGVLAGRAALGSFNEIIRVPSGLGATGKAYLVSRDHTLLTPLQGADPGMQVHSSAIRAVLETRTKGFDTYKDFRGVTVNGSYRWLPELGAALIVEEDKAEAAQAGRVMLAVNASVMIAAIIIAAFASLLVTRGIATPLSDLAETANRIAAGQLDLTVETKRNDEIGALAEAFNFMTARLRNTLEGLRKSEEKYRGIFENALEGMFQTSIDGRVLSANPAMARIIGYDSQYELMANITDIRTQLYCYPEERDSMISELLNSGKVIGRECRFYRRDKQMIWVSISATLVRDDSGSPMYIEGMLNDITGRKVAEEALAEARNYLDKIINSVADPIFVKDRQHRFVLINDACCDLIGRNREELLGKSEFDLFPRDEADDFWTKDEMVFQSAEENVNEEKMTDAAGVVHTLATKKTLHIDESGEKFIVGVSRDITEQRKMELELIKAQKLESVGILAGGIAHDFNNLLTAILGNISLSKILISPQDKAYERLIDAEKASLRAKDLTQRLLTFSRGGTPVKKTLSPVELIRDSAGLACSGSRAICDLSVPDDLWPIDADEGQISQAINNIVMNAIQAMPDGGTVCVNCGNVFIGESEDLPLRPGRYVRISISDQGGGVPEEYLGRIFDPYFTTKEKGRGLGLATTYSIIRNHEGYIAVESTVGTGTTFTIYLPASDLNVAPGESDETGVISGKGRILVMDDEEVIRQVAKDMLEYIGYDAAVAKDGDEALHKYKAAFDAGRPFDVVIMDLTIPGGMGGKEAIKKLIETDPGVRAIVSSGYSNDPVMSNFREYGFVGVILKPYQIAELSEQIGKVLHAG